MKKQAGPPRLAFLSHNAKKAGQLAGREKMDVCIGKIKCYISRLFFFVFTMVTR
ncbi:hypothetical protein B4098_0252 [Heyndrickxia coagulans]|uniref:Uncharacterized protein n=1 Tax=Heyndrickxia coagulans TaxID=1398 RepID=A0A150K6V0_HEYCO|nr:hypothetical protein B4098_0252 [Heyndrickxia coagulans]